MSLRATASRDLSRVLLAERDLGLVSSYWCRGAAAGFPLPVVFGEPAASVLVSGSAVDDARRAQAFAPTSAVRAGALAVLGVARGAQRGDLVVVADEAEAGRWVVEQATTDAGGATVLDLRLERTHAAAGQGARKDGAA